MNVFVLTGMNPYESAVVLGVYSSRDMANTAAAKFNSEDEYPYDIYNVNEVTIDADPKDHFMGDEVEIFNGIEAG